MEEKFSDCCGASSNEEDILRDTCPDCKEHCEFNDVAHTCVNCGDTEVEVEGQPCSIECHREYWGEMNRDEIWN